MSFLGDCKNILLFLSKTWANGLVEHQGAITHAVFALLSLISLYERKRETSYLSSLLGVIRYKLIM